MENCEKVTIGNLRAKYLFYALHEYSKNFKTHMIDLESLMRYAELRNAWFDAETGNFLSEDGFNSEELTGDDLNFIKKIECILKNAKYEYLNDKGRWDYLPYEYNEKTGEYKRVELLWDY